MTVEGPLGDPLLGASSIISRHVLQVGAVIPLKIFLAHMPSHNVGIHIRIPNAITAQIRNTSLLSDREKGEIGVTPEALAQFDLRVIG